MIVDKFYRLEYKNINGLNCTTENQTIIDLMENNSDEQIIIESLANYYDIHGESFQGLNISNHLKEKFQQYREWAKAYYED